MRFISSGGLITGAAVTSGMKLMEINFVGKLTSVKVCGGKWGDLRVGNADTSLLQYCTWREVCKKHHIARGLAPLLNFSSVGFQGLFLFFVKQGPCIAFLAQPWW